MGASLFLLFVLGILLATAGGIIGLVEAFRVNTTWGVLSLIVPFALLVFFMKFFRQRKWTRNGGGFLDSGWRGYFIRAVSVPFF